MKKAQILLVEDNEGDIFLTTEALEQSKLINKTHVVRNGKDAIDFVLKKGKFKKSVTPDLILLDINLPLKNGHEVLQAIKSNPETAIIPVIMLTTSSSDKDICLSYKHHANCYISKPVEIENFYKAVASIEHFWFKLVKLPSNK